ncbi:hypothetical protein [Streptomyces olivaceus]|uniref:hypothetical protein n=1 Tax=Streptomyces olivaceus TaxID=47716 RepID=UPI00367B8A6F
MAQPILPDSYWAGMILGRVVHLHLTLVEAELYRAHREEEDALVATGRVAMTAVSQLNGAKPGDRVFARLLGSVVQTGLPQSVRLPEQFARKEISWSDDASALPILVYDDQATGLPESGLRDVLRHVDLLGLTPLIRLGVGLVGIDSVPDGFEQACRRECVFLAPADWAASVPALAELLLAEAARSLVRMWAEAETRAYSLSSVPSSDELVEAFATGVVAEYRRRRGEDQGDALSRLPHSPAQVEDLPLVSELVRCWWPMPGRAQSIFGSPFDYMTKLEPLRAHR